MTRRPRSTLIGIAARSALVPVSAFAVHQLRFFLAYGNGAGAVLAATGHAYLHSVVPWITLLAGLSVGVFLRALGEAAAGRRSAPSRGLSFLGLWLACAACLLAIYCAQEFLEGSFAIGHPTGLAGIFGFGGLWAVPSSIGVGLVLATILHGARRTLELVSSRHRSAFHVPARRVPRVPHPGDTLRASVAPLVQGWSDRGPPLLAMACA